jgi:type I restriction enzyme S subunit
MINFLDFIPTGVQEYSGKRKYYSTGSITGKNYVPEGECLFSARPSRANRMAQPGDAFQARMFGTDKALLIDTSLSGQLFSTGFLQFRIIKNTYINKLLYYFLKSRYFLSQRDEYATGSTQIALTDDGASKIKLIVPPLNEQRRIVAKLEKLLYKVDICKERLETIPVILKRLRQSVVAAACSGRLTADWRNENQMEDVAEGSQLPPGWRWIPIKELLPPGGIFDGPFGSNLKTADYTDNGIRVVRLENVGSLQFFHQKEAYISQEKYKGLSKHTVGAGDIIFASFIDEEVRACLLPKLKTKAIAKADCFCVRPRQDVVDRHYLTLQLVSRESYERLSKNIHGATRPRINTTQLRNLEVRICPLAEQHEIVRRVEAMFKLAEAVEKRVAAASARAEKLTQAILGKAFRGELVATEAEIARREGRSYETASELLARIKSDRESKGGSK